MTVLTVATSARVDLVDITSLVQAEVQRSRVDQGQVTVFVPHTTCGITINEHADPDVAADIKHQLEKMVPPRAGYRHREGNADSHIKTSLVGSSETVLIADGRLQLGTWQGIFLCDFDGPRSRKVYLNILAG